VSVVQTADRSDAISVRLCGWCLTDEPEAVVRALLGPARCAAPEGLGDGNWQAQPAPADEPVGPPIALLGVQGPADGTLDFVPGSQGMGRPPVGLRHVVRDLSPRGDEWLLVDARCWTRFRSADFRETVLWQADVALEVAR
jgi:hypothetical protein